MAHDPAEQERAADAASASGWPARAGRVLFRFRSLTPVPLIAVAVPLLWRSRGPASPLWPWAGVLLCCAGQALRAWVLGQVPDGTSGQDDKLIAASLNTSGPYAHTRNPLYLGNLGITLGLCLVAHQPWLLALVAALFALQYAAIIAVEEAFLRARFGAAYDAFCARVPRFWPRLSAAPPPGGAPARPFSWGRVVRKEHNPLAAWLLIALLLAALDRAVPALRAGAQPLPRALGVWPHLVAAGAVIAGWLWAKGWKHRWLSGGFGDDLRRRLGGG